MKLETEGVVVIKEEQTRPPMPYDPPSSEMPQGVVPSCAGWFDLRSIHQLEVEALPEFFNQKYPAKSPQSYMMFRNYIIKLYRENPKTLLTATTCRRQIPGDACAIIRIHAFLEHWGLINYDCPKEYSAPCSDFTPMDHPPRYRRKVFESGRPFCASCNKACELTWFRSGEKAVCNACFGKEQDTAGFVKDSLLEHFRYSDLVKSEGWSVEETTRLLEAVEKHGEQWEQVAVDTGKTVEECQSRWGEIPLADIENLEAEKMTDYTVASSEPEVDFTKAIDSAVEIRRQEDVRISSLMSEIVDYQLQKLSLKAQYVKDIDQILWLQQQQYKAQLQQLLTAQASVTIVKQQRRT